MDLGTRAKSIKRALAAFATDWFPFAHGRLRDGFGDNLEVGNHHSMIGMFRPDRLYAQWAEMAGGPNAVDPQEREVIDDRVSPADAGPVERVVQVSGHEPKDGVARWRVEVATKN